MKTHLIMNDFQFCTLLDPANGCSSNTNYFSSHNSISKKYYDGNGLMRKETIDNYFGKNELTYRWCHSSKRYYNGNKLMRKWLQQWTISLIVM